MELSTSKEIKALGALIATLTAEVTALDLLVRPEPAPLNSKRGPESSPSPNATTKHPTKRKTCPDPIQLDGEFAKNDVYEVITEDDGGSQRMEAMEPVYPQSRSNSPGFENRISTNNHVLSTRIDKPQSRSWGHTCRRSGSKLSYIGIYAAGLKNKILLLFDGGNTSAFNIVPLSFS
jgi:hypothetical protein